MLTQHSHNRTRLVLIAAIGSGLSWSGVGLPGPVNAQGPDPATQLYVSYISAGWFHAGGTAKQSLAYVDIVDGNGNPVNGALVVGNWSGCFKFSGASDTTETVCTAPNGTPIECVDGRAVIWGKRHTCVNKDCTFTFTITGVQKDGMTYAPVAGKTSSGITCKSFGATASRGTKAAWASSRQVVTCKQETPTQRLARWWRR